jgi:hypothetical protein
VTEPQPPPLQADSPTQLPDGGLRPRYRPPGVGGGEFAVDLARAPQAIRELREAEAELRSIKDEAVSLGRVLPPSNDQVSLDAAQVLGVAAVGGNGSFLQALDLGVQQIGAMIEGLEASLRRYGVADEQSRAELS